MNEAKIIRQKDRDAVVQSLRAGVVPARGQHLIQVGREAELRALMADLDRVVDGGSGVRFVIGPYGAGKTFFLNLVRAVAMERRLVTVHADLSPDRRLHSTGGHARALFAELMANMATRAKPDGGALPGVVERFIGEALVEARERSVTPDVVIRDRMDSLSEFASGYAFAQVVECYWRGHDTGDERLEADAVRWLRGEFGTKTEARAALGVRAILDDDGFLDHLKLMARFVRLAGFGGLVVCLDEMVNLYKMHSARARNSNYEQLLRIVNDALQGAAPGLAFLLGGTPEFLTDTRKGLYSYPALQSRLAENAFAQDGLVDLSGPVIRLANLAPEDLYVLLMNIRNVFAWGDPSKHLIPDEALRAFMDHCSSRIGDAWFRTPRNSVKEFVHLLSVLEQNPGTDWRTLLGAIDLEDEPNPDLAPIPGTEEDGGDDDELASFRI